ncbi:hypothetical protein AVEN_159848-1 [Araneus ventricosus]|uniref:Uncharacterized protein n=1 Tax=Araneus ventricosus TaxID=182803 RepID=A0A4Y2HFN5_ARAVE|nr:hypothetical protein AVEN_159848-1 [Araneus ventricosus]
MNLNFVKGPQNGFNFGLDRPTHAQVFQNGIFGTREGKKQSSRSKTYEIWNKLFETMELKKNSKSKTQCADSNLRPRCEASGTSKDLTKLRLRDEARKSEIRRVGEGSKSYGSAL